jgi:hypothetical protein
MQDNFSCWEGETATPAQSRPQAWKNRISDSRPTEHMTREDIRAAIAYAADTLANEETSPWESAG